MATFFALAKKYIHSSFNATVFAMAFPLEWCDCTDLTHSCRELQLKEKLLQAGCLLNLIITLKITSSLCFPAQLNQLVVLAIFQRVKFSSHCGAVVTSLPKVAIVELKLGHVHYSFILLNSQGGKNFHVFHYLLYGIDADKLQEYWLSRDFPHR